jgi:hypothetical protein
LRSFHVASDQNQPFYATPISHASPVSRHDGTPETEPCPLRYATQPRTQPLAPVQTFAGTSHPEPVLSVSQPPAPPCRPQARIYPQAVAQTCCPARPSQPTDQYPVLDDEGVGIAAYTSPEPSLPVEPEVSELSKPTGNYNQRYQNDDCNNGLSAYPSPQDANTQVFPIVHVEEDVDCPNTSSCYCPPTSTVKERPLDTGLLISCETAATIIAEMRGDGDRHRIRASLGCHGDQECNVKNSVVLELMDER